MARQLSLFKSKRQRGVAPPSATEDKLHFLVADILHRCRSPGWWHHHSPLGEKRDLITAAKIKRMGATPGWFDFVLLSPDRIPHFLELKRRGMGLNDNQKIFQRYLLDHSYPHAVADTFDDALLILKHWGAVRVSVSA